MNKTFTPPLPQRNLVSIIVPVYNVQHYISTTIESVIDQTYQNWELILIDNGSTDEYTSRILNRYQKIDKRIHVIKIEQNNGPNPARNLGLDSSTGEWTMLLDSDDMLNANSLEWLIEGSRMHPEADFVKGSHTVILDKGKNEITTKFEKLRRPFANKIMDGGEFMRDITRLHGVYFACIYRTEFLSKHNIRFHEEITANGIDDQPFLIQVMLYGKGVYIDCPTYRYRIYQNSTSHSIKASQKIIDADIAAIKVFLEYYNMAKDVVLKTEIKKFLDLAFFATLVVIVKSKKAIRKPNIKRLRKIKYLPHPNGYKQLALLRSFQYIPSLYNLI